MNQLTTTINPTESQIKYALENDEACEHVESGTNKVHAIFNEDDSFGPLCRYAVCKKCYDKAMAEQAEETETCCDCKKEVKRKDGAEWKWYDFYAPQGDEPMFICFECRKKETHINRVKKDRESYEEEMR